MRKLGLLVALLVLACAPSAHAASRLVIRGAGFGHGIGMSQYGAYGLALQGVGYQQILTRYYTGTALARVASERGNPVRAARYWGVAEALSEDIGATTAPLDRAAYERHLVEARALLGGAAFAAAWAEGRTMTPEDAVEAVLGERE